MITKVITQDSLRNTHIYNYKTYTYSQKISTKCSKCGKKIYSTFSFIYMNEPTEEQWERLEEQKKDWLSKEHFCSKCLKDVCKNEQTSMDMTTINTYFKEMKSIYEEINKLTNSLKNFKNIIGKDIIGKICIYKGKEYVITYMSTDNSCYRIHCYKINTIRPWQRTETLMYITDNNEGYGNVINANIKDVVFTNEIFAERYEKIRKFKNERL